MNKERLQEYNERLSTNNVSLEEIKNKINELPTIPNPTQLEITPTKEEQTFEGLYDKIDVVGDNDLVPENIKEGKEIFGVTGTAQTVGYEWEHIDPINIVNLLDNDKEEYEFKAIILLANNGTNEYTIKYSDRFYNSGDLIRGSDGGELTIGGTKTYTFDESKDFINSLGQRVRYFIVYKKTRTVSGNKPSYFDDTLMWYFKNCTVGETGTDYFSSTSKGKTILFDKDTILAVTSQNLATNCPTIEKYEMPDNCTVEYLSLTHSFASCYNLKKARLNLNNQVNQIKTAFQQNYSLEDALLINCPDIDIDCTNMCSSCYSLKNFVAKPILRPTNTGVLFSSSYALEKMSGIDFKNITTNWSMYNCHNLVIIENVANININFTLSNSTWLTHDSIMNLINAYVDLTGQTTKTLTIGTKNLLKISDEEKAIAINKNVTLA